MGKKDAQINAFFGKDTEFEGKLSFSGTVRIDGRFKGEIIAQGTLIIGETALIESDARVTQVIISGKFQGNVIAEHRIEILAPAEVFGNIQAPVVIIQEGVIFDGHCRMQKEADLADKKVAVLTSKTGPKNGSEG